MIPVDLAVRRRWPGYVLAAAWLFWPVFCASEDSRPLLPDIDPLPPALNGIMVEIRQTENPQIVVFNLTPEPLTILDDSGRAFLRLDQLGVHGDYASEAFHHSRYAEPRPLPNNAHGAPRWYAISPSPSWGWFDTRLRVPAQDKIASPKRWRIPVRLGDTKTYISGHFLSAAAEHVNQRVIIRTPDIGIEQLSVHAMAGQRPGVFVHNRGMATFTVTGVENEPFLSFRPGKVMVNSHSPTWEKAAPPETPAPYTPSADKTPYWVVVSGVGGFGWADPRVQTATSPPALKQWVIPIQHGGMRRQIEGTTEILKPGSLNQP